MRKTLSLLLMGAVLLMGYEATACTNFLFTKGATKDGSTMITYAADSHVLYGELYYRKAADYPAGTMRLHIYPVPQEHGFKEVILAFEDCTDMTGLREE